jgi:hypothetical protein
MPRLAIRSLTYERCSPGVWRASAASPKTLAETGLSIVMMRDILLKTMFRTNQDLVTNLSGHLPAGPADAGTGRPGPQPAHDRGDRHAARDRATKWAIS